MDHKDVSRWFIQVFHQNNAIDFIIYLVNFYVDDIPMKLSEKFRPLDFSLFLEDEIDVPEPDDGVRLCWKRQSNNFNCIFLWTSTTFKWNYLH